VEREQSCEICCKIGKKTALIQLQAQEAEEVLEPALAESALV
jgi:hypothetical protein